jgi:hypothetical protein
MIKRKCYNCKHASKGFKVNRLTHHHCLETTELKGVKGMTGWETLRVYSDTCDKHEFKQTRSK